MDNEDISEIIKILGKDKIEELYCYIGSKPVSISRLHRFLLNLNICEELRNGTTTFREIAKKIGISEKKVSRVYEYMKGLDKTEKNVRKVFGHLY